MHDWKIPEGLFYDGNDFWLKRDGHLAFIGLTDVGQDDVGDVLFVELPCEGSALVKGQAFGSLESGKWAGVLTAPVSGTVTARNEAVLRLPRLVGQDPYGEGWLLKLAIGDEGEVARLMSAAEYAELVRTRDAAQEPGP